MKNKKIFLKNAIFKRPLFLKYCTVAIDDFSMKKSLIHYVHRYIITDRYVIQRLLRNNAWRLYYVARVP